MSFSDYGTLCSGPPSAVVNLTATNQADSINISWDQPWSLNVTGVDHDVLYNISCYNVMDKDHPTLISCTDCTNITETVYTFTPDHLSPCHVYNFSVTPFNGAGQGESSHNVTGYVTNGEYLFSIILCCFHIMTNLSSVETDIKLSIRALNRTTCRVTFGPLVSFSVYAVLSVLA